MDKRDPRAPKEGAEPDELVGKELDDDDDGDGRFGGTDGGGRRPRLCLPGLRGLP